MKTSYWMLLLSICFLSSCVSSYQPIRPQELMYLNNNTAEGVEFSFNYDLLNHKKNKKFKKKASKNNVQLVAIEIKNTSDEILYFGENLKLFSDNTTITPIPPTVVAKELKQSIAPYFLYLLLTPTNFYVDNGRTRESYPVGLVAGPALTMATAGTAMGANKRLEKDLLALDPTGKPIAPNATVSGLIAIRRQQAIPLRLEVTKKQMQNTVTSSNE